MKKMIILVGLLCTVSSSAIALDRVLMEDYLPVADRDFAFEIKTSKFDKVILDCGGFAGWMTFYRDGKITNNVYMDTYFDCPNMHDFLNSSKEKKIPVCLQVEGKDLIVSNVEDDCL